VQATECLEWQAVTAGEAQPHTFQGTPLQCCLSSLHSLLASHTSHTNVGCCTPNHVRRSKIMQRGTAHKTSILAATGHGMDIMLDAAHTTGFCQDNCQDPTGWSVL
jgi:hypothetical protein